MNDNTPILQRSVLDLYRDLDILADNVASLGRGKRRRCALLVAQIREDVEELRNMVKDLRDLYLEAAQVLYSKTVNLGANIRRAAQFSDYAEVNLDNLLSSIRSLRNSVMALQINNPAVAAGPPLEPQRT